MKISIVLPAYFNGPLGGYHVHYNYANLLQARGHQVCIIFPHTLSLSSDWKERIKSPLWALKTRLQNRPLTPHFKLRDDVQIKFVSDLSGPSLPKADALIATAWQTAELLRYAPDNRGRKFYIVYDYEFWRTVEPATRVRMERTYSIDFEIIATSGAVEAMLTQCGALPRARIPCGIDFDAFGRDVASTDRAPLTLGFPARKKAFKGAADAIVAATLLREIYGDRLHVTAFGSDEIEMPQWISRLRRPSQPNLREFYNNNAVFMVPSHFEGWGLPGCEAMACGAALVTTDNGGSQDYAIADMTALVVPPKEPRVLAAAVNRLFQDPLLRSEIAERGHTFVQQFRWERSADKLERLLQDVVASRGEL
ncbi:glycosyltransferase family 4 protein [Methylosinus sp. Ce-a6]|uniref:glycosyltransferase family 4 protein n=1 Tax=Methylosinus sp. Ce-a6 TaxID=2172005 RepID=UPI00135A449E|nr:glycosyltransferase family 4 protein [Methylosinus sp. Ce-a6]